MKFDDSSAREIAASFDLRQLPPEFYDNPYPFYAALREHAPVKRMPDGSYFLTRYSDVSYVYRNPKLFSSDKKREFKPKYGDSLLYEHHTSSLVFNDPPLHTHVRRLIAGALTPQAIAQMRPGLVGLVEHLLDAMARKDEVDLIADFAAAIPIEIIGNLLAVPPNERAPLRDWSLAILSALEPVVSQESAQRGNRAVGEFLDYLTWLTAARRKQPGDPKRDVLTRLIFGEEDGERLSEPELLHNCIFLLNAGHETTTNLIGNGLVALLRHPQEKQKLIAHPELVGSAVEEFLRFESSNQLGNRATTQPVEISGVPLPAETLITLCIGAANRDPQQFEHPERMSIERSPNRHLAFGGGIHQCVGMGLARLEASVAIEHFLARFPQYELSGTPLRGGRARFRGFARVPCQTQA
jgi:cytochrome P450